MDSIVAYSAQQLITHGDLGVFSIELYDVALLLIGCGILIASIMPRLAAKNRSITAPMLYLCLGLVIFLLPWAPELPDLMNDIHWAKRFAEMGVILALTSAGLRLNHPFAWNSWRVSWRLLAVTMPLTIAASAWLGWWAAGLLPVSALLLGAAIAPTDPVLAGDVEVPEPNGPEESTSRLALTTEAGINDGLAFPFTNLAIALALVGLAPSGWLGGWLVMDVFYKITAGALIGAGSGYLIAKIIFSPLSKITRGVLALSLTLVPYGLAELASSYGFIAVFVAACVYRHYESSHEYQELVHDFSEAIVRLMIAVLMFFVGAYICCGIFGLMTPAMWGVAFAIVFLVRPISGLIALVGTGLPPRQRLAISFFGIRGLGSIYYLAYGLFHADFPDAMKIWAIVLAVILISVVIHGITAVTVMQQLDSEELKGKFKLVWKRT